MKIKYPCCGSLHTHDRLYDTARISYTRSVPARLCLSLFSCLLTLYLTCILAPVQTHAQPVYNVAYGNVNFPDARKIHKVGSNGETVGSKTLYTNVVTVDGQQIDCIITTVSLTNGFFTLPLSPTPGTIPYDYSSEGGTGMSANQDRFFSPTFFFNSGGGSCKFKFEFILGGSFDETTKKGSPVILQNVMINSYDIDGVSCASGATPNTNQFNEFSGFNAAARATPGTNIQVSYNPTSGLTKFRSSTFCNYTNVLDPVTRIRIEYNYLQDLEYVVGAENTGRAFFLLDFGPGPDWTPQYITSPVLDLNTSIAGYNNNVSYCMGTVNLASGGANISNANNTINELTITIPRSDIKDGSNEIIASDIYSSSTYITLGSPFFGTTYFSITGTNYKVDKSEVSGVLVMKFTKSTGGTLTNAETEKLIDALVYKNSVNSAGQRRFTVYFRENNVTSTYGYWEIYGGCIVLNSKVTDFIAMPDGEEIRLSWRSVENGTISHYMVQRSTDGNNWQTIRTLPAAQKGEIAASYSCQDKPFSNGTYQYRLAETDMNGNRAYSPVRFVNFKTLTTGTRIFPNPVQDGKLQLLKNTSGPVRIYDSRMSLIWERNLEAGHHVIDLTGKNRGVYFLKEDTRTQRFVIQ